MMKEKKDWKGQPRSSYTSGVSRKADVNDIDRSLISQVTELDV